MLNISEEEWNKAVEGIKPMKTYRVWAKMTTYCYVDIEAEDESEANEIAWETDGGDFIEDDSSPYGGGSWDILEDETTEVV